MSVVCKMFIQSRVESPGLTDATSYQLGVVCRGEENKHWAAATPSGQLKGVSHIALDQVWAERQSGERPNPEVLVYIVPDTNGEWKMDGCNFSYGGCAVTLHRSGSGSWGEMTMNVNALPATEVLRRAYAEGLLAGKAPTFRLDIKPSND